MPPMPMPMPMPMPTSMSLSRGFRTSCPSSSSFRNQLGSSLNRFRRGIMLASSSSSSFSSSAEASASEAASASSASESSMITVRVYAKEIATSPNHTNNVDTTVNDCPLCEALVNKCEKFMQAVAYDPASRLNQANLEIVRLPNEHPKAINTPFITICLGNSQKEFQVDRPSPRASAQQVQKVVEKAVLAAAAAQE